MCVCVMCVYVCVCVCVYVMCVYVMCVYVCVNVCVCDVCMCVCVCGVCVCVSVCASLSGMAPFHPGPSSQQSCGPSSQPVLQAEPDSGTSVLPPVELHESLMSLWKALQGSER